MSRLIQDLLDAAKIEAQGLQPERRAENVGELLDTAVEGFRLLAAERSIQVRAEPPPTVAVWCDRHLILRVLSNLLGNAVKFCPAGGRIDLQAHGANGEVLFSVKDTGPGIPPELLPHVFDRYWQQTHRPGGSGLGLYIVKGIVEAHGGRVWMESAPGLGTTVRFTLPMFENTQPAPAPAH